MAVNPDFRDLFSELCAVKARFMIVGAHVVIFYAAPRYTKDLDDLDIWVEPSQENARRVFDALARFGAPLADLTIDDLATSGTILQLGIEPNRIDLITQIKGLTFERAWERRIRTSYGGVPISVLGIDDLVVNKREVGRPQDLLDLEQLQQAKKRNSNPE
ncbi:MAG: nucleotidyltransferase [Acidobacteriota bacterium]